MLIGQSIEQVVAYGQAMPVLPNLPPGATGWIENDGNGGYRKVLVGPAP